MAVSGSTENVQTVLTIDTSKSVSSMKELRDQIKSLKDQLVGLDQGTEEYQNTVVQLGEKMHQLKEINEEVRRTNSDFGDTLGNVSNVMAGGVAAVQGLTAGLSLLGIEMGDDNKLTQTLVKSMALLQSLGSMDKAIKSFRALSLVIKSNITAAGGLGKALKALAVSNPFTAILAAATAVIGVFSAITNASKEAAEKSKQHWEDMAEQVEQAFADTDTLTKYFNLTEEYSMQWSKAGDDAQRRIQKLMDTYGGDLEWATQKAIDELDELRKQAIKDHQDWLKTDYMLQMAYLSKSQQAAVNALESLKGIYDDYNKSQEDAQKKAEEARKKAAEAAKKAAEDRKAKEKTLYDIALKRLQLQKTLDDTELTARYEQEKRDAQGNAQQLLAIEEKYQAERQILNERYYKNAIALAEEYKKKVKDPAEQVGLDQTIANLNQSLQEGADAWEAYKKENAAANIELEKTKLDAQANIDSLDRQTAAMEREIETTRAHNERYLELIKQKWTLQADLDAEAIRYQQEQLQNSNLNIEDDLAALRTKHDAEMELLQEQYEQKLIAEEEFQQRKAELEAQYNNESMSLLQQHFENEAALDELAVEAKKNETERKKELEQTYMSAISSISSSITSVLNEAANAEDVSFEDQKKLKIASTIITTLESGMLAMKDMMEAGGPWGVAAGAVAMAATIATGMMQVNKIRQTNKSSAGSASASAGAMKTIQSPAQIVNLNAVNDQIEIPDSRVYVVESDITNAQNRVQVVENNSTI